MRLLLIAAAIAIATNAAAQPSDQPAGLPDYYFAELPGLPPISGHARALDGDTLRFEDGTRVRLHAVSAPEMSEWPWGPWARAMVDRMIIATVVTCHPTGAETHGRVVAICATADVPDIGAALIAAGLATEHRVYSGDGGIGATYRSAEAVAITERRGVWSAWRWPSLEAD